MPAIMSARWSRKCAPTAWCGCSIRRIPRAAGQELRLRQEYFFSSASIQDIVRRHIQYHGDIRTLPDKAAIQLNDTHPAVAVAELMRLLVDVHGLEFDEAWEITRKTVGYTNHTLLPEALESWPLPLFERLLPRHMQIVYAINSRVLREARRSGMDEAEIAAISLIDEGGERRVRMANLAFAGAHSVNGVAALHTELMKTTVFSSLHKLYPGKINNKTNGVTPRRWLQQCNPGLTATIRDAIGDGFLDDAEQLVALNKLAGDAALGERIAEVKRSNKVALAAHLKTLTGIRLNPDALFDVQIKRIHEYKRQLLNLIETVALYDQIRSHPERDWVPRVKIFGGKAAPSYHNAKLIIKLANDIARRVNSDPSVGGLLKVVFVPNYNVTLAERIIPAADLSEQISTAGMEASGTGNMKFALNGALTIGTLDGANIEIKDRVGDDNIVIFGLTADEVAEKRANGYDPRELIEGSRELRQAIEAIASGVFSPDDPHRYAELMDGIYDHDWFMVAADFDAYAAAQRKSRYLLGRSGPLAQDGDPQHRQCRLVLVRPHHRRICEGHLGSSVKPPGEAIAALLEGIHADPFSLLGIHEGPQGAFARAVLPGARKRRGLRPLRQEAGQAEAHRRSRAVRREGQGRSAPAGEVSLQGRCPRMVGDRCLQLRPGARPDRRSADRRGHPLPPVRQAGRASASCTRARAASISRSGRPTPATSRWSAISTTGTTAATRCGDAPISACGKSSSPTSARAAPTNTASPAPTARSCRSRPIPSPSPPNCARPPPRSPPIRSSPTGATPPTARIGPAADARREPMSIYEVHPGSWQRDDNGWFLTWDAMAERLIPYVAEMGFTHIEFMPVCEHPYDPSWGYQTTGLYAPSARFGDAAGFARFVDGAHRAGHFGADRLGARAFPHRRARPRPFRRHRALRARRPAARLPSRLEHRDLQFRAARSGELPGQQRAVLGRALSCRRPARRCRRLDALPRLQPQGGRMDPQQGRRARELGGGRLPAGDEQGALWQPCRDS